MGEGGGWSHEGGNGEEREEGPGDGVKEGQMCEGRGGGGEEMRRRWDWMLLKGSCPRRAGRKSRRQEAQRGRPRPGAGKRLRVTPSPLPVAGRGWKQP